MNISVFVGMISIAVSNCKCHFRPVVFFYFIDYSTSLGPASNLGIVGEKQTVNGELAKTPIPASRLKSYGGLDGSCILGGSDCCLHSLQCCGLEVESYVRFPNRTADSHWKPTTHRIYSLRSGLFRMYSHRERSLYHRYFVDPRSE